MIVHFYETYIVGSDKWYNVAWKDKKHNEE